MHKLQQLFLQIQILYNWINTKCGFTKNIDICIYRYICLTCLKHIDTHTYILWGSRIAWEKYVHDTCILSTFTAQIIAATKLFLGF